MTNSTKRRRISFSTSTRHCWTSKCSTRSLFAYLVMPVRCVNRLPELILYSQAYSLSGEYTDFGKLSVAVLRMVATVRQVPLSNADIEEFIETMHSLRHIPRYPRHSSASDKRASGW